MRSQAARKNSAATNLRNLRTLLLLNVLEPEVIGERIKVARERSGLRQEDLAALINVSTRTVQNLEAGDVKPYTHLKAVAVATKVTVEWLLHGDSEETEEDRLAVLEGRIERLARESEEARAILAELLRLARRGQEEPPDPQA